MRELTGQERLRLPPGERGASFDEIRELEKINRRLARGYKPHRGRTVDEQREADLKRRAEIEASASTRQEVREVSEGVEESAQLAEARGETVERQPSGLVRIIDHDPVLSLARAGVLSARQLEVAEAVCALYAIRQSDLASKPYDGMPAGMHNHEHFIASRFVKAKASVPAAQLETAILVGHYRSVTGTLFVLKCWPELKLAGMEPHVSLTVLRKVCEQRHTLTSLGRGRAYERHKRAFLDAIAVADEVLDRR